jgi:hypothetical protein
MVQDLMNLIYLAGLFFLIGFIWKVFKNNIRG